MATVDRNTVKSWFVKYAKPTADQFARFFDSIIFKGEKIPTSSVEDFDSIMLAKADNETFENHVKDSSRHLSPEERIKWNNKVDKENGKMLSSNDYTDQDKQKLKALPFSADLQNLLNRDILSITITGDKNKILTLTKIDGTILSAPFNDLGNSADVFLNGLNFNAANGTFTAVLNDSKTSSVNIDGRYSLLNHHHDDRYLKFQAGAVSEEVKFEAPVFFEDTIQARNPILILESMAQMDSGPGNKVVSKEFILSKIPTKTSQLNNDSGFAYISNVPNIRIVAIGGVITSNTLNVLYKESEYPIKTILINKEAGNEAAYIRISSTKWLKLNSNLI